MWLVVLALLLLFFACLADVAAGLGWIWLPFGADDFYGILAYGRGLLKRYVIDQRPEVVAAVLLVACALHSLLLSFFPAKATHWLRSDGLTRFALTTGWAPKLDAAMFRIRQHPALALILKAVELATRLALLPVSIGARIALDPQNSRLCVACLFAPVAVAVVLWAAIDAFLEPLVERFVPPGFLDSPGSGRNKEKIVWVSAGVLAIVGGGYEVARRWVAPDLAKWFVGGRTHPLAFQWGLGAAVGAALVLAGLHLDGNLVAGPTCDLQDGASVCKEGEAPGQPLVPSPVPQTPELAKENALMDQSIASQKSLGVATELPPSPLANLQPREVHVGALLVACAAVATLHVGLPVFNRREYAYLKLFS
jgi:hypothetical protein